MKLVMDLPSTILLRAVMDEDRRDVIVSLCTQIGMIMEDASALALTVRSVANDHLAGRIGEIDTAVRRIQVLTLAAAVLGAREAQT